MNAPRPKLGDVFGKRPPDRSEGLGGLLSPSPRTPPDNAAPAAPAAPPSTPRVTAPQEDEDESASEPTSDERPVASAPTRSGTGARPVRADSEPSGRPASVTSTRPRKQTRNRPGRPANPEASDDLRLVPVNLDASVHSVLKDFSTRIERTFGVIVLEAVESTADELAVTWKSEQQRPEPHRLFVGYTSAQQRRRRKEPAMQVLLRLPSRDAETLDQLVSEWEAPSRSALVTEALRRYLARAS